MTTCFCTLAIQASYRSRARLLIGDLKRVPWVVLTDEPADFADLRVRAVQHSPTGPMAVDYLTRLETTGPAHGAAAYHDKRFALMAALEDFDTAIFVDADSRISRLPLWMRAFPPGLAVLPEVRLTTIEHLKLYGAWRLPIFIELAKHLTGSDEILNSAIWCDESCYAITKDGNEAKFFETWGNAADFMQGNEVFTGEGGVMGIAAAHAGLTVNNKALKSLGQQIRHEGGGPKAV